MAGHAAELRITRKKAEHIQELLTEVSAQERTVVHLLSMMVRAVFSFFTIASLIVGLVTLIDGKDKVAAIWGGIGLALAVVWLGTKGASLGLARAKAYLREESSGEPPESRR